MTNRELLELVADTLEREQAKEKEEFEPILKRIEERPALGHKELPSPEEREDKRLLTEHINYQRGMQNLAVKIMEQLG
jgi:hypothetical protein